MRKKHTITKADIGKSFKVYDSHRRSLVWVEKIIEVLSCDYRYKPYDYREADSDIPHYGNVEISTRHLHNDLYFVELSKLEQIILFGKLL